MSARENLSYREPAREPPRRLTYGPFASEPIAIVLVIALLALWVVAFETAEARSEVECTRRRPEATPTCVRRSWMLSEPDVERSTPATLRRDYMASGFALDVLEYDGVSLILPNNPPGPLSELLETPSQLHARDTQNDPLSDGFFVLVLAVLAAFVLPRALDFVGRRSLTIDRAARTLRIEGVSPSAIELELDEVQAIVVETLGDGAIAKLRGARVVIRRKGDTALPLAGYARPPLGQHLHFAREIAKAIGVPVEVVRETSLRSSAPLRSGWLVAQVGGAIVVGAAVVAALR